MTSMLEKNSPQSTILPDAINPVLDAGVPPEKKSSHRANFFLSLAYLLFSLGWVAPMLSIAILNFRSYVVGTTLPCGAKLCRADPWGVEAAGSQQFETVDQEILNALQLAAKALEIWFVFLAGALVFNVTMLLVGKGDGLPIRHLKIPFDYTKLEAFLHPSLWTSIIPLTDARLGPRSDDTGNLRAKTKTYSLYIFVVFVLAISIVCNLMGPVAAILLLPTLSWREVEVPEKYSVFTGMASADPPMNLSIIGGSWCTLSSLSAGNYSYMPSNIDTMLSQADGTIPSVNSENLLSFVFSFSPDPIFNSFDILAPNRQVLDSINDDYYGWSSTYNPDYNPPVGLANFSTSTFQALSNARAVIVNRQGPTLLFSGGCLAGVSKSTIQISNVQGVLCYNISGYDIPTVFPASGTYNGANLSTMCIPTGSGWPGNNAYSEFQVANSSSPNPMVVNLHSADKAIYLNQTTYHCSVENTTDSTSCDWSSMFAADPDVNMRNVSINPLVTEYYNSDKSSFWICLSFSFLRLSTYILDTSGNNPFSLGPIQLQGAGIINPEDDPLYIHPDWVLASMSVDVGGTVPEYRSSSTSLVDAFQYSTYSTDITEAHSIIMGQALSLINYVTEAVNTTSNNLPTSTPILKVSLLVYAWMYGLQSITSRLGVAIAIIGCVIVLLGVVVKTWRRTVSRDLLDFIMVALKQPPPDVLKNLEQKETAKVRFRMRNRKDTQFEF